MYKKYRVVLAEQQQLWLRTSISTGSLSHTANTHARILLKADTASGAPGWSDEQISDAFDVCVRTVVRVREAFAKRGLQHAVEPKKPAPRRPYKIDGTIEAHVVALACAPAPAGHARWTVRLLSDRVVELCDGVQISHESVRQILKKTNLHLG